MALVKKTKSLQIRPFQRYTYNGTLQHPRFVVEQLNILAVSSIHAKEFEKSESILKKALKICEYHTNVAENPWKPSLLVWTLHSFAQVCIVIYNLIIYNFTL